MFTWSVRRVLALVSASLLLLLTTAGVASAQGPPQVSWVATNPGGLATSAGAVAWSPTGDIVATGLLDRWMRVRSASDGHEIFAILQPHRSGGVVNLTFSTDGKYLAVGNQSGTGTFNVYDVSSRAFLGQLVATVDSTGILRFAPDAQLAPSPAGSLSRWRIAEVTVFSVTGSGYDKITTARNLSPNGQLQTAATSKGTITIQRTSDGSSRADPDWVGTRPAFSPDSSMLAEWTASPNGIRVRRISDGAVLQTFVTAGRRRRRRAAALHPGRRARRGQRVSALPQARRHMGPEGCDPVLEHFEWRAGQDLRPADQPRRDHASGVLVERQVPLRPLRRRVRRRSHTRLRRCRPPVFRLGLAEV